MTMTQTDGSTVNAHMLYQRAAPGSGFAGTWEGTSAELPAFECRIEPYEGEGLTFSYPGQQRTQHLKFDGKDYPTVGPNVSEGSTSSGRRVNERTIRTSSKSKGTVTSTQELIVSPDLKTLTTTQRPVGQAKPNVFVFDRQ
jgi:hypothetical protein